MLTSILIVCVYKTQFYYKNIILLTHSHEFYINDKYTHLYFYALCLYVFCEVNKDDYY